ncbi:unnamed protein product [Cuscuta europaea]|uniref:Uncharacterized protein n=1 Tax=Cuscuta europaea TaxID=41803 RepID=A0A9P0Z2C7_CUSEU|nr:unnamed protein product [Cuscuta europaea]
MTEREEDSDLDAPEEFTAIQGIEQDEQIRKVERDNKSRVVREAKERRRKWAEKLTPRPKHNKKSNKDATESEVPPEEPEDATTRGGMLPDSIVQLLVAREKKVFISDSEEEEAPQKRPASEKKRPKRSGLKHVIMMKEIPPPQCIEKSMDFLKKRKMQVQRSSAVLNNSNQALRLLSSTGLLSSNKR